MNTDRSDNHIILTQLSTSKGLRSVMSFTFALCEKTDTPLIDALFLNLSKCSSSDMSAIKEWKCFGNPCIASLILTQNVLRKKRFVKTIMNTEEKTPFTVFYRNRVEVL